MSSISRQLVLFTCTMLLGVGIARGGDIYVQTNLVSNGAVSAQQIDANLQDPWGLAFSASGPAWISDQASDVNGSPVTTVYSVTANPNPSLPPTSSGVKLTVAVPNQGGAAPGGEINGPTGQVSTSAPGISTGSSEFLINGAGSAKSAFIFANLDGSISAWGGGKTATIETSVSGASFTGLAIANTSTGSQIYAADQNSGNVDVFNSKWQMTGSFTDPNFAKFPTGYSAFNVQTLIVNGSQVVFVTFANQSTSGGIVDEFKPDGTFIKTLINDTGPNATLDAPWGLALAPSNWGKYSGDLLVGNNNGPGEINAYNLDGVFQGTLMLNTGQPFGEADLWAISFGNGGSSGATNTLFFTAGLDSNTDGLFGSVDVASVPEPSSVVMGLIAASFLAGGFVWKKARGI